MSFLLSRSLFAVFTVSLAGLAAATTAPVAAAPAALTIDPADPRLRYEGRFDFSDHAAPVVVWQASRIALDFTGPRAAVLFDAKSGESYFNVTVDDRTYVAGVPAGGSVRAETPFALGPGRHHLVIFKRSEASAGVAIFRGIELAAGAEAFAPPEPDYKLAVLFIGDSITAGACNEDGPSDQWSTRRTHNNALSYGALAADALGADYRNIAVSGMGIVTGYVEPKAGEVWDRIYPEAKSPRADLGLWRPDLVFVNFGENDDSFTRGHGQPFPSAAFTQGYIDLVHAIRAAYPQAGIVILRGGMYGGAKSDVLRAAWEPAVKALEASDPAVSHYVFTHWSSNHPRVADDRAMADELVAWLKQQPLFAKFR